MRSHIVSSTPSESEPEEEREDVEGLEGNEWIEESELVEVKLLDESDEGSGRQSREEERRAGVWMVLTSWWRIDALLTAKRR